VIQPRGRGSVHSLAWLREPRSFARFLQTLHGHKWVVYVKKPFGGPEHVLQRLARVFSSSVNGVDYQSRGGYGPSRPDRGTGGALVKMSDKFV
jgi:hypothetical protein